MQLDDRSAELIGELNLQVPAEVLAMLHPEVSYRLRMLDSLLGGREAVTDFGTEDGIPEIGLSKGRSLDEYHRLFIHELAHVFAGIDAGHGVAWERVEARLHIAVATRAVGSTRADTQGSE